MSDYLRFFKSLTGKRKENITLRQALMKKIKERNDVMNLVKFDGWHHYINKINSMAAGITLDHKNDEELFKQDKDKFLVHEIVRREKQRWLGAVDSIIEEGDRAEMKLRELDLSTKEEDN